MTDSPSIHYETVATAFQVLDIAEPLVTTAPPNWLVADVWAAIMEDSKERPENWFALIRDDDGIRGYIPLDYEGSSQSDAAESCLPITADQIVAGTLPLLDLIPLFREHFFFFVLTRNDLTHIVSYLDLDKLPVKLCLFALLTGLEAEIVRLLSRSKPEIERYLARLPEHRLRIAREWCRTRYGDKHITPERILRATSLTDKVTMLLTEPKLLSALPFTSRSQAEAFFDQLRESRNRIAHSDSILEELNTPEAFNQLLSQLRRVTDVVSDLASQPQDNNSAFST